MANVHSSYSHNIAYVFLVGWKFNENWLSGLIGARLRRYTYGGKKLKQFFDRFLHFNVRACFFFLGGKNGQVCKLSESVRLCIRHVYNTVGYNTCGYLSVLDNL